METEVELGGLEDLAQLNLPYLGMETQQPPDGWTGLRPLIFLI